MNIPRFARDLQLYSCIAIEIFFCSFITLTFSFVLSVVSGVTKGTSCKKKIQAFFSFFFSKFVFCYNCFLILIFHYRL